MRNIKPLMLERVKFTCDDEQQYKQQDEQLYDTNEQEIILDVDNKIIYIDGRIKTDTYRLFSACVDEIIEAHNGDVNSITLEINSEGGSIHSSYMMVEKVKQLISQGIEVIGNAGEFAMSGGCALFLHCSQRNVRKYTQLMFHSAILPVVENVNFAELDACEKRLEIAWLALEDTLRERTKLTEDEIQSIKRNPLDYYLNCFDAIEKGFADKII